MSGTPQNAEYALRLRLLPVLDGAVESGLLTRDEAFHVLDAVDARRIVPRLGSCCVNVGTDRCACEAPTDWTMPDGLGLCPACKERKFIGHGPLCVDCFDLRKSPGLSSTTGGPE